MRYSANSVWENKDKYDVVVIGAGHAGCEAKTGDGKTGLSDTGIYRKCGQHCDDAL